MSRPAKLAERIESVHAEIDKLIAARVDEMAAESPGVPKGALERMLTARAHHPSEYCRCAALKLLDEKHG
jgi:hypothetical protein